MSHHDDQAEAAAYGFDILARWKRKPWYYRAWAQVKQFFSARNIHRLLTKWHLWSPWKLIPYVQYAIFDQRNVTEGDELYDASARQRYRILKEEGLFCDKDYTVESLRYRWTVAQIPPVNLVRRWDKREHIEGGIPMTCSSMLRLGNSIKL